MGNLQGTGHGVVSFHVRLRRGMPVVLLAATLVMISPVLADQGPGLMSVNGENQFGSNDFDDGAGSPEAMIEGGAVNRYTSPGGLTVIGECDPFKNAKISVGPDVVTIVSTLDGTPEIATPTYFASTGIQTGRLTRDGIPSECGSVKPNPGLFAPTGDRQYDQYRFVALSDGCVTVTLREAGDDLLFSLAYNQSGINISDPSINHLADIGSSPVAADPSKSYGFDVTAGQIFNIVVHEVNPGGGFGQTYTLDVGGVKLVPDFSVGGTLDTFTSSLSPAYYSATGNQTGRLNRFNPPSTCETPKPNPGLFTAADSRRADLYAFYPAGTGCALVSVTHTGVDSTQVVTYDENGYVPSDPSVNYYADSGGSAINSTVFYSYRVTTGVPFFVVTSEVNPGAGIGDDYVLNISNVPLVPTMIIRDVLDTSTPQARPEYTTGTGLQTGRINRFPPIATCDLPKPSPGLFSPTGDRQYDVYTFTPPASGCVEVTARTEVVGFDLYVVAYDQLGFNPANPEANFLADYGNSPNVDNPRTFSFNVTAGVPFSVVVHEVNPGGGIGQYYDLRVGGIAFQQFFLPFFEDGFESGNTLGWDVTFP